MHLVNKFSANIVCKLGPVAYEVSTNGHLRHDHLRPKPETPDMQLDSNAPPSCGLSSDHDSARTPLVIVDDSSNNDEQQDAVMNSMPEIVVRPQHNCLPPYRLRLIAKLISIHFLGEGLIHFPKNISAVKKGED